MRCRRSPTIYSISCATMTLMDPSVGPPAFTDSTALSTFATWLNAELVCRSCMYGHARGMLDVRSHPSDIREQSAGRSDVVSGEVMRSTSVGGACGAHHLAVCRSFLLVSLHTDRGPQSVFAENVKQSRQLLHNLQHHASPAARYGDLPLLPRNGGAVFQA